MTVKVRQQEELSMRSHIRSLPLEMQAELEVIRRLCPDIELYPDGEELFQLYRGGFPKKGPMSQSDMLRWLDGFREGFLEHDNQPAPQRPQ